MIFSTSKTELQKALQKLSKATPTRSTLPILSCVLINAKEDQTTLKTTDLELTIQVNIPSSVEQEGAKALPLKTLLDITNELPETRLTIKINERDNAKIITDLGEYDLMARPAEEYPENKEGELLNKIKMPGPVIKNIIDATVFAVSKDELKPALTGVFFQISPKGTVAVSTDGHRLVKHEQTSYKTKEETIETIIPKKFLTYLSAHKTDEEINLYFEKTQLKAQVEKDIITTRTIGENFPNYESVIPTENTKKFILKKNDLLGAIRRVSIFSNKATHQVALSLNNTGCKITTEDPEKASKAQESIIGEYDGESIVIGYNADYLKDVVSHVVGENIIIELSNPVSAALFSSTKKQKDTETTMLLMPIRLND